MLFKLLGKTFLRHVLCVSPDIPFVAVYSVFFLETLQTALSGADLYYWFVSGFGNMNHLASPYASAFDVPIIGSVVSLSVQYFFVYRIWVLGKRETWWLCFIICLVTLLPNFRSKNGLIVPVGLHCRRNSGVHRGSICEPPPLRFALHGTWLNYCRCMSTGDSPLEEY